MPKAKKPTGGRGPGPRGPHREPKLGPDPRAPLTPEVVEEPLRDGRLVSGRQLRPNQWTAFETYWMTSSLKKAAAAAGVHYYTVWDWKRSTWWDELFNRLVKDAQESFHAKLSRHAETMADAVIEVAEGKDKDDKTAAARVNAAKLFSQLGAEPLIRQKGVEITNNTLNATGTIVVNRNATKDLSQLDMMKIITGEMPFPETKVDDDS